KHSIAQIPHIKALLQSIDSKAIAHFNDLEPLDDLLQTLQDSLVDEPPLSVKEGGLFKEGYHPQLDEYLDASRNGKTWLAELQ
ncbi:hypothetical protein, partial [Staphylococcus aureus]